MLASAGLENVIDGVNLQVKNSRAARDISRLESSEGFYNPLGYCFGGVRK